MEAECSLCTNPDVRTQLSSMPSEDLQIPRSTTPKQSSIAMNEAFGAIFFRDRECEHCDDGLERNCAQSRKLFVTKSPTGKAKPSATGN